jgi:hypothetical protein
MRQITLADVQDTFLANDGPDAIDITHPNQRVEIGVLMTDIEKLQSMGLEDADIIAVSVMVFGAFTAGALTAQRLIREEN